PWVARSDSRIAKGTACAIIGATRLVESLERSLGERIALPTPKASNLKHLRHREGAVSSGRRRPESLDMRGLLPLADEPDYGRTSAGPSLNRPGFIGDSV